MMMRNNIFLLLLLLSITCIAQDSSLAWNSTYKEIEKRIHSSKFPDRDFNIKTFGAKCNDSLFLNHKAINKAIAQCSKKGGGRVVVPAGTWYTGPIILQSRVNLHLEKGAVLLFSNDVKLYPLVLTRWEGSDCYNYQPLIYAHGQTDIAVTGNGVIDGGATFADWWSHKSEMPNQWNKWLDAQKTGRETLMKWNADGVPVIERKLKNGLGLRTQLLHFYQCQNVLIEDLTFLRSPFWVLHPFLCTNVTIRGVEVNSNGPNNDGCDPESCKDVLIENCIFNTGDDCIALKSGRNADGRLWNTPCENIIVRNCKMKNGHGGLVIGSEISGGARNIFVEDCEMDSPLLDRVIRIKTNTCRGGVIDGVYVRNIQVGVCREAILKINLLYSPDEVCNRGYAPIVRNVYLEKITSNQSDYGIVLVGLSDQENISDIYLTNCQFNDVSQGGNYFAGKMRNVVLKNVNYSGIVSF